MFDSWCGLCFVYSETRSECPWGLHNLLLNGRSRVFGWSERDVDDSPQPPSLVSQGLCITEKVKSEA